MYARTLGMVAAASMILVACGGDDGPTGPQCMGTEMSVPGQAHDPCPQNNAACVAQGGKAYAVCVNGQWGNTCDCITSTGRTGSSTLPTTTTQMPTCGDAVIAAPEKCDGMNLNGATCQTLGYNGGGTLLCNATTCNYDTIMCRMTGTTSGGAGLGGGAGMGGGGTGS